jgi:hypothetical protein
MCRSCSIDVALSSGSRLGSYEILAPLGEGGMGVVYRARDTRLGREVAVKVLPDLVADDPDRLARFIREAQTLAALNHPNIAQIHGIEDPSTGSGQGVRALVLELVEGEDLSVLIARGPMAIPDATPIARQIAEGLEAAHELGIVHRDLKPANIKVRSDGTVKILDFGLAKALNPDRQAGSPDLMQSPTLTARSTAMGVILGTAAYMAPEQAKGRTVDRRADIWAFGVILHEMLTGQRLFHGDSLPETLAHVIARDVDLASLPPDTPPHLRSLIARCLVKDPKLRLRDIGEARLALSGEASPASGPVAIPAAVASTGQSKRPALREMLAWSLAGILTVAGGYLVWSRSAPVAAPVLRLGFTLDAPVSMTGLGIAIAPDAHAIVIEAPWHSGDSRLYLRRLNGSDLVPLAGTEGGRRPFWSPDSRAIAFSADQRLKRVDLDDGSVRDICPADLVHSGAWGAGGTILFATTEGPLRRVQASGGAATPLPLDDSVAEVRQVAPVFVAGSRRFLYTSIRSDGSVRVRLGSLDDDRRLDFPAPGRRIVWAGKDRVIFPQASVLSVQRVDYEAPAFIGEPDAIATDVDVGWIGGRETVSDTGIVAFVQQADRTRQFNWYSRTGGTAQPIGPPGEYMTFDLSPGDRRIAANVRTVNRNDIWIIDAARGSTSPLTVDDRDDVDPRWSPDGRSVMFGSTRDPSRSPFLAAVNGDAPSRVFQFSGRTFALDDWSPDGRWVLFHDALESVLRARLVDPAVRAGETKDQEIVLARPLKGSADQTRMSPDGRWVVYNSSESGRPEVYVVPFPPTGDRLQVSPQGGVQPIWRADGRELFFLALDGTLMTVSVSGGQSFTASEPVALFKPRVQPVTELIEQYAVNEDGTRFLVLEPPIAAKGPVVQVIANWEAALERPSRR